MENNFLVHRYTVADWNAILGTLDARENSGVPHKQMDPARYLTIQALVGIGLEIRSLANVLDALEKTYDAAQRP